MQSVHIQSSDMSLPIYSEVLNLATMIRWLLKEWMHAPAVRKDADLFNIRFYASPQFSCTQEQVSLYSTAYQSTSRLEQLVRRSLTTVNQCKAIKESHVHLEIRSCLM